MNIPKTIKGAETKLTKIDGIVTATEWERSAIVYAFTEVSESRAHLHAGSSMSVSGFAAIGIVGLKSKDTVRRYHEAWQSAVDAEVALPVQPGDPFIEPDMEWPPEGRTPRQAGATVPRVAKAMQETSYIEEVVDASQPDASPEAVANQALLSKTTEFTQVLLDY